MDRTELRRRIHTDRDLGGTDEDGGVLEFAVESSTWGTVLRVSGEIDLANAPALASLISTHSETLRVLDLSQVSFIDCQGLAALRNSTDRARSAGNHLQILTCPALQRLTSMFDMQDTLDIAAGC